MIPMDLLQGIDFSMTALFLVIVTEQTMDALEAWREGKESLTDALFAPVLGGTATLLSLLFFGKDSFLLGSMVAMLLGFAVKYRTEQGRKQA